MEKNSVSYPCKKGHPHNTEDGMKRCNLKYAERRVKRDINRGNPIYRAIKHDPPIALDKGGIVVLMFYSALRIA